METPRPTAASSRERMATIAGNLWFKVLNVSISASAEEVKRAYRHLALLHHPDKAHGDADTFKRVKEAYETGLKKSQKRLAMAMKREAKEAQSKVKKSDPKKAGARKKTTAKENSDPCEKKSKDAASGSSNKRPKTGQAEEKAEKAAKPKPWRLAEGAARAKICKAVDLWQRSERWQDKTKPEQVQTATTKEFAMYLQGNNCIPVDVRDTAEETMVRLV
jgi:hypothetical protein